MTEEPRDNFETYFAEKLWEMIPAVYRHEDTLIARDRRQTDQSDNLAEPLRGPLRELVELWAAQAAVLRRSNDRLWLDQFVEYCSDWAIPYIGDLLGTRIVSALSPGARRVDVAKTIYYRRRKGTLRVLEELVSDMTTWEGTVVENFRRLARMRHGLDPRPGKYAGPISGTPPGGWADIRNVHPGALIMGAFDELHYTLDIRRHRGGTGRYAIPKVAFYLYRLRAYRVDNAIPSKLADDTYTFDPSGRAVPLFKPRNRHQDPTEPFGQTATEENWENWRLAEEWQLPGPVCCRLLHQIMDQGKDAHILQIATKGPAAPRQAAGRIENKDRVPPDVDLLIDPAVGRFALNAASVPPQRVSYYYGAPGPIGAGTYDRREHLKLGVVRDLTQADPPGDGVTEIRDSATYYPVNSIDDVKEMVLQAANYHRPYLLLRKTGRSIVDSDWVLDTSANEDAQLTFDGLWIGVSTKERIVLRGNYEKVMIRNSTLDPGGVNALDKTIAPVHLIVAGYVEEMIVVNSITGPIHTEADGHIEKLTITDSIVQATVKTTEALKLTGGCVMLKAVTILGAIRVHRLFATDSIVTGDARVTDVQSGCFRFSAAGVGRQVPAPYRCCRLEPDQGLFKSEHFGDPDFARLADTAPPPLRSGGEDNLEMGAFNKLRDPVKLDNLKAKVQEYLPFGLIPLYIFDT
jgi:hypothetical protein